MPDLVEMASAIISSAQQHAEIAALNVANATAPAYKRKISFDEQVGLADSTRQSAARVATATDFTPGKLVRTGNPYDLAVSGPGFLPVMHGESLRYVRAGRFTRAADGRLVDAFGAALQKADGGDLIVTAGDFKVSTSGEVIDGGAGRIRALTAPQGVRLAPVEGGFAEPRADMSVSAEAEIIQGAYEASNVSLGDEMVNMMQAIRRAESGQRVMLAYDDIMGRVLTSFGESVR